MIYRLPKENIEALKKLLETGMGYQIITTPYERETYIVWNRQLAFEQKGFDLHDLKTLKDQIKNKTFNDILGLVILKNGHVLDNHKVLNSSILILEKDEKFKNEEIVSIELE